MDRISEQLLAKISLPILFFYRYLLNSKMASTVSIPAPSGRKITVPTGLFIDNKFVPSVDSQELLTYVFLRGIVEKLS